MRIIAIETSGRHGSLAALEANSGYESESGQARLVRQIEITGEPRTAQVLAPTLRELLSAINWTPTTLGMVAVSVGPGSFTGLRIGVTTAKTLAYATDSQVVGVNTLVALAAQAPAAEGRLWTALDAQRQELFVAQFQGDWRSLITAQCDTTIVPKESWLAGLQPGDRVTGPALHRLADRLPEGVGVVPEEYWQPMATVVGQVAWKAYDAGHRDDVWKLAPQYYRPSYAEEKLQSNRDR